ncbi:MAG: hypothetical protein P8X78_04380, partial [Nitrosopumilaceae archaeon]
DDNPNDQKIEEVAAEGYKVKKPEDKKKKDNLVEEQTPEVTEQTPEVTEQTPEVTKESAETVTEFDESVTLVVTSSTTTVCHIPPGKPGNNKTLTIGESALAAHLRHGDVQPTCENPINPSNIVVQAPESESFVAESNSLSAKLIRVSADTAATFSDLPAINSKLDYQWKLYGSVDGEMVDYTDDPNVNLLLLDLDSDNTLDRAEWSTTDGVTEYYLVAKIILATDGLHLDSDRNYVDDIFYEIKEKDNIWTYEIPAGDFVRVTFERNLDSGNHIAIFANSSGFASIEVYEKDGTELITTFNDVSEAALSKAKLTNLETNQATFDLKVIGSSIQFDQIIDPATIDIQQCHNAKPTINNCEHISSNQKYWATGQAGSSNSIIGFGHSQNYRIVFEDIATVVCGTPEAMQGNKQLQPPDCRPPEGWT